MFYSSRPSPTVSRSIPLLLCPIFRFLLFPCSPSYRNRSPIVCHRISLPSFRHRSSPTPSNTPFSPFPPCRPTPPRWQTQVLALMPLPPFSEMPRPSGHQSPAGGHCRCSPSMDVCPSLTPWLAGRGFVSSHSSSFSVTPPLPASPRPSPSLLTPPHLFLTLPDRPSSPLLLFLSCHVHLCFPFSHLPFPALISYLPRPSYPKYLSSVLFLPFYVFSTSSSLIRPFLPFLSCSWHIKNLSQRHEANTVWFCLIYYSEISTAASL